MMNDSLRIDLHIHTTASDGCWSPEQVVEQVKQLGIGLFAVTDHENVDHLEPTAELARRSGVGFLPGVELSSKLNGRVVHILGYGFDLSQQRFLDFVQTNEQMLHRYDDFLVQQLIDHGYEIDLDAYETYSWDRHRGGWKALNFLIDLGLCRDVHSFFTELFVGPLQVTFPDFPVPEQVIAEIRQAGGVAVWAHPANNMSKPPHVDPAEDEQVIARMVAAGVQGLECYTCHHNAEWTQFFLERAQRYELLVTGGSDSHGGFAGRQLGSPTVLLNQLHLERLADCILW